MGGGNLKAEQDGFRSSFVVRSGDRVELYQLVVTACAGVITIITLLEKLGLTARVKKMDNEFNEMRKMLSTIPDINATQKEFVTLQEGQNNALLALLRNELYQSFRLNRDLGVWTDDECFVQTKLHQAYKSLNGNGEEEIWWEKKKTWRIVSNTEYRELMLKKQNK